MTRHGQSLAGVTCNVVVIRIVEQRGVVVVGMILCASAALSALVDRTLAGRRWRPRFVGSPWSLASVFEVPIVTFAMRHPVALLQR